MLSDRDIVFTAVLLSRAEQNSEKYETNKYDKLKSKHWFSMNKEMNNRDKAFPNEKEEKTQQQRNTKLSIDIFNSFISYSSLSLALFWLLFPFIILKSHWSIHYMQITHINKKKHFRMKKRKRNDNN